MLHDKAPTMTNSRLVFNAINIRLSVPFPVAADFPTTGNDQMQAPFAASLPTTQPVVQVGAQATTQPSVAATLQAYNAEKRSGTCVCFFNILPHVALHLNPFPIPPPPPLALDAQKSRFLVPPCLQSNLCIFLPDHAPVQTLSSY